MGKTAVVVGAAGQDGRYLFERLASEGARVIGLSRGAGWSTDGSWTEAVELADDAAVARLVRETKPDEVYYLAGHHQPSEHRREPALELFRESEKVHLLGAIHFLEAIGGRSPQTRFFYAASRRVFGQPRSELQDERAPIDPEDIYGVTKAAGLFACRYYRRRRGLFACAGILFNHESARRQDEFLSRRIVLAARAIQAGGPVQLKVTDLEARADWGYAPDYVEAMTRIMALPQPDDFVVATGTLRPVRELIAGVFSRLGLDWSKHVTVTGATGGGPRPAAAGDASKLTQATGWRPSAGFEGLLDALVKEDVSARA